jgi:hypothetical protein
MSNEIESVAQGTPEQGTPATAGAASPKPCKCGAETSPGRKTCEACRNDSTQQRRAFRLAERAQNQEDAKDWNSKVEIKDSDARLILRNERGIKEDHVIEVCLRNAHVAANNHGIPFNDFLIRNSLNVTLDKYEAAKALEEMKLQPQQEKQLAELRATAAKNFAEGKRIGCYLASLDESYEDMWLYAEDTDDAVIQFHQNARIGQEGTFFLFNSSGDVEGFISPEAVAESEAWYAQNEEDFAREDAEKAVQATAAKEGSCSSA